MSKNSPLKRIVSIGIAIPMILLTVALYPFIHNEYISSLGRFSKTIELGQTEPEVLVSLQNFQAKHSENTEIRDVLSTIDLYGERGEEVRIVSLYQESLFENIEFRVLFKNSSVAQKIFISD